MDPPRVINNLEDLRDSYLKAGVEDILIDRAYFAVHAMKTEIYLTWILQISGDTV